MAESREIDSWPIRLNRDSDFWQDSLTVTDEDDNPVTFNDVSLVITPPTGPDVRWGIGAELSMPSAGVINFVVMKAAIAAYEWAKAAYRLEVVYTNGKINGRLITGLVEVS